MTRPSIAAPCCIDGRVKPGHDGWGDSPAMTVQRLSGHDGWGDFLAMTVGASHAFALRRSVAPAQRAAARPVLPTVSPGADAGLRDAGPGHRPGRYRY